MAKVRDQSLSYDTRAAARECMIDCSGEPSRTKQSFAEEADINYIAKRFGLTGQLPVQAALPPSNIDFDAVFDYQSAQNVLIAADRAFAALPAQVRSRFANNPAEFVRFCSDAKNIDAMRELGLAVPKAPEVAAGNAGRAANSGAGSSGAAT